MTYPVSLKSEKICSLLLFACVFVISMSFAAYTEHAWEDWYITYRASKNLALGNGLVFTVGERVHSFTSPLGTLLPAVLNFLTANRSDDLVLWLFRTINCCLLGFSAMMLMRMANRLNMLILPTVMMCGLFALDAKIIDFSINGQETALMMFFLVATIYTLSVSTRHAAIKLGMAWGGLMWTRPDSIVYIGGLALGYLLFNPVTPGSKSRVEIVKLFGKAGLTTFIIYLPWTLWTWYYYATPIPHTITAKGLLHNNLGTAQLTRILLFPYKTFFDASSVINTFLPSYFELGGWPGTYIYAYGVFALLCTYYWCLPFVPPVGRALSFAAFLGHLYLTTVAPTIYPWYIPSVTLLSILVTGHLAQQVNTLCASAQHRIFRNVVPVLWAGAVTVLVGSLSLTLATAYQMKLQQILIENNNRKQIGLWLKENAASPKDTVFLECLGYIGFYSQLKMLDFPGMSSPEVVRTRRTLHTNNYAPLIASLRPDWLVLRPQEISAIDGSAPELLTTAYRQEMLFDASETIRSFPYIPGRQYLQYDQTFVIYRKLRT